MITLTARKERLYARQVGKYAAGFQTFLYKPDGTLFATFSTANKNHPRKGQKTIVINCNTYALNWD